MSVVVGVSVHDEPARLAATLRTLRARTAHDVRIVAVPDRPSREVLVALARTEQVAEDGRPGGAAAFNRLLRFAPGADVIVLLESGAIVADGWLDPLLEALRDPGIGLAGPSTDRHWGRQQADAPADGIVDLAPLHDIGDFCLAVHRRTVDAIGGADVGFATGPCWELEYAARAARAGLGAVWARRSWVGRAPATERRQHEEDAGFDAARRRFQDRLCGRRLGDGPGGPYREHCRGDACPNFAPAQRIQLRIDIGPPPHPRPVTPSPVPRPAGRPLVSAIMPTSGRPAWVARAVGWFAAQRDVDAELVVVHDAGDGLAAALGQPDPRVRLVPAPPGESIGAKRNRAVAAAHGVVIAHWDDDDWFGPDRLAAQAAPIVAGRAEVSGLVATHFLDVDAGRLWRPSARLHQRLFFGDVHGGTLAFARRLWEQGVRYPDWSLAEDAELLRRALRAGARLARIDGEGRFVYIRHGTNTWHLQGGHAVGAGPDWQPVSAPVGLDPDAFVVPGRTATAPSVTAIMPTADRRAFVPRALALFARQDHPDAELLVVDDGDDPINDLIGAGLPRVRYLRLDRRLVLGDKRNHACELARGDLIAHWDDDDWYAPDRLRRQAALLARDGADVTGQDQLLFVDAGARRAWRYRYPPGPVRWLAGTTLCYRRDAWRRRPFPSLQVGEDTLFVRSPGLRLHAHPEELAIAFLHAQGTSPKQLTGHLWREEGLDAARTLLGGDGAAFLQPAGRASTISESA